MKTLYMFVILVFVVVYNKPTYAEMEAVKKCNQQPCYVSDEKMSVVNDMFDSQEFDVFSRDGKTIYKLENPYYLIITQSGYVQKIDLRDYWFDTRSDVKVVSHAKIAVTDNTIFILTSFDGVANEKTWKLEYNHSCFVAIDEKTWKLKWKTRILVKSEDVFNPLVLNMYPDIFISYGRPVKDNEDYPRMTWREAKQLYFEGGSKYVKKEYDENAPAHVVIIKTEEKRIYYTPFYYQPLEKKNVKHEFADEYSRKLFEYLEKVGEVDYNNENLLLSEEYYIWYREKIESLRGEEKDFFISHPYYRIK